MLKIGHDTLTRRHENANREIKRLRDLVRLRDATIGKLRQQLADAKRPATVIVTQPQRHCGCRHCIEVANRSRRTPQ